MFDAETRSPTSAPADSRVKPPHNFPGHRNGGSPMIPKTILIPQDPKSWPPWSFFDTCFCLVNLRCVFLSSYSWFGQHVHVDLFYVPSRMLPECSDTKLAADVPCLPCFVEKSPKWNSETGVTLAFHLCSLSSPERARTRNCTPQIKKLPETPNLIW